jgi:carboxylesterase type B
MLTFSDSLIPTANISQAWHTSDIPVLFGTTQDSTGEAPTDVEVQFGNYIRKAWATFAADPAAGLSKAPYNWPLYQPTESTLILLGQDNTTTAAYASPATVDTGC